MLPKLGSAGVDVTLFLSSFDFGEVRVDDFRIVAGLATSAA